MGPGKVCLRTTGTGSFDISEQMKDSCNISLHVQCTWVQIKASSTKECDRARQMRQLIGTQHREKAASS